MGHELPVRRGTARARRMVKYHDLSPESQRILVLVQLHERSGQPATTSVLAHETRTRTGPANRKLMRLKRRGLIVLVIDPVGDKGARVWRIKK